MHLESIIGFLILFAASWAIFRIFWFKVTVFEYERGLKYVHGRHNSILEPGQHWIFKPNSTVTKVDVRPRVLAIPGQEVLSSDGIALKLSLAAQFAITDPYVAINRVANYHDALYLILQVAAREIIGSHKVDEVLEKRGTLGTQFMEATTSAASEIGIKLTSVNIKDIMFPGDLKKVFAQVVKAQKEGLATLEKARGESAALRHLLNAAKVLENNPTLMQLRILQSLGESSGNTIVLGLPQGTMPIPIRGKSDIAKAESGSSGSPEDAE